MITGDHTGTATAIARQSNLIDESQTAITGKTLAETSDQELPELAEKNAVFARADMSKVTRYVPTWFPKPSCGLMDRFIDGINRPNQFLKYFRLGHFQGFQSGATK